MVSGALYGIRGGNRGVRRGFRTVSETFHDGSEDSQLVSDVLQSRFRGFTLQKRFTGPRRRLAPLKARPRSLHVFESFAGSQVRYRGSK